MNSSPPRNIPKSLISGVKSTANDILRMKIHLAEKNYTTDKFVSEMDKKTQKTYLPLINRGVWSRVYGFDHNIYNIISYLKEIEYEEEINFIDLGSGFNTMFFNLEDKFENMKYIEIDYEDNTDRKIEIIKKSELLKNTISKNFEEDVKINEGNLISKKYSIINCDVTNPDLLIKNLKQLDVNFSNLTIVLGECLFVYIEKDDTMNLLKSLTTNFDNMVLFMYDLVGNNDAFGREMEFNLAQRNIKIPGLNQVPDTKSQIKRLIDSDFSEAKVVDMLQYYRKYIDKVERMRIEKLEFLDELEEFNLLQKHSCFGCAIKISKDNKDFQIDDLKKCVDLFNN